MMARKDQKRGERGWHTATRLVHEGTLRSQFGETSEAIFLNSGYVYTSAEQAEARFKGDEEGFVYSRYANPTVSMFEERMAILANQHGESGRTRIGERSKNAVSVFRLRLLGSLAPCSRDCRQEQHDDEQE